MVACEAPASAADVAPPILKLCDSQLAGAGDGDALEKPESGKWTTIDKAE